MPNEYKRETVPGWGLARSTRVEPLNIKIAAKYDQLWKALARHHRLALNALLVWALEEFRKQGSAGGSEPEGLGSGLKWPDKRYSITQKFSAEEIKMWSDLASARGVGRGAVAVSALVELYRREPVDLKNAVMPRSFRRE